MRYRLAGVMVVIVAITVGCVRDVLAPVFEQGTVGDHPADLALLAANRNLCSIIVWSDAPRSRAHATQWVERIRDGLVGTGKTIGAVTGDGAGRDSFGRFRYARWDPASKQKLLEATCVVPLTHDADVAATSFFKTWSPTSDHEKLAALGSSGALFTAWTGQWVQCYYYPSTDDITCDEGNVYCMLWALSRSPARGASFTVARARASATSPAGSPLTSTYACDNECSIVDFNGYVCPSTGGTEFDGGVWA